MEEVDIAGDDIIRMTANRGFQDSVVVGIPANAEAFGRRDKIAAESEEVGEGFPGPAVDSVFVPDPRKKKNGRDFFEKG